MIVQIFVKTCVFDLLKHYESNKKHCTYLVEQEIGEKLTKENLMAFKQLAKEKLYDEIINKAI